ncbi:MAG: hypothetical protein HQL31_11085, partial [Planctomycetes bacterium]|nr:hypothetical protein [Planctomycetota bacterium]
MFSIDWLASLRFYDPAWLLRALLATGTTWFCLWKPGNPLPRRIFLWLGCFCLTLIFLPNVLYALTSKYQFWVLSAGSRGYVGTYYSFFGLCALLAASALTLSSRLSKAFPRFLLAAACAGLVFPTVLKISAWNDAELRSKVASHRKWALLDDFLDSQPFRDCPEGSIIYAPKLKSRTVMIAGEPTPDYWSRFVFWKTGRHMDIVTSSDLIVSRLSNATPVNFFYLGYTRDLNLPEAAMLFGRASRVQVEEDREEPLQVFGSLAYLYFRSHQTLRTLLYRDSLGPASMTLNSPAETGHFMTSLEHPDLCLNSVTPVNNPDAAELLSPINRPETTAIVYGEGFHGLERNANQVWNWAGKKAELRIQNPSWLTKKILFLFTLSGGWADNRTVLLTAGANVLRLEMPLWGEVPLPVSLPLNVPPEGLSLLFECPAQRVDSPSPDDPRPIAFGIFNPEIQCLGWEGGREPCLFFPDADWKFGSGFHGLEHNGDDTWSWATKTAALEIRSPS